MSYSFTSKWMGFRLVHLLLVVLASVCLAEANDKDRRPAQVVFPPNLGVYGGWGVDPFVSPFLFSWNTRMHVFGGNWKPRSNIKLHLRGPLNNITIPPTDRILGTMFTDEFGSINGTIENTAAYFDIPYDGGITGNLGVGLPNIPAPGHYEVFGVLDDPSIAQIASVSGGVQILPQTDPGFIDWGRVRGFRSGFLGGHSPEFLDPEWVTVWSHKPIAMYGTVAETNDIANNQPMKVSHHEAPGSHYSHDANLKIVPDFQYKWVLGTANLKGEDGDDDFGRIELEWELQNNYTPGSYGQGVVGMPLWLQGTAGDRVYTVGAWVMDGGHRGSGYRTEIHPPRMLAMIRKYNAVVPLDTPENLVPAKQVDIFVSGHGGGINHYYDGLESLLDRNGQGGGRLEDFMSTALGNRTVYDVYHRYGPGEGFAVDTIEAFYNFVGTAEVFKVAGPGAIGTDVNTGLPATWNHENPPPAHIIPWTLGPEERPINDMDYEFEVVLPAPPTEKTRPVLHVETHPEHTTAVNEVVTYFDEHPVTGLPRRARIKLPYNGADNGVYARTLKFSWNRYSWPGRHFRVRIDEVKFFLPEIVPVPPGGYPWNQFTGNDQFWVNVCGQWRHLTGIKPSAFLNGQLQKTARFDDDAPVFDVYLDNNDMMMLYTCGYDACSLESKYVQDIGTSPYQQGLSIIDSFLATGDNKRLGSALFSRHPNPASSVGGGLVGQHFDTGGFSVSGDPPAEHYSSSHVIGFTITHIPNPKADVSPSAINFGDVVLGSTTQKKITIGNLAKPFSPDTPFEALHVTPSATGGGYSVAFAGQTLGVGPSLSVEVPVTFSPTLTTQGTGSVTLATDDPSAPTITIPLTANILYPELTAVTASDQIGPTVVGCTRSQTVTVSNTGTSDLVFKPVISGAGYSIAPYGGDVNGFLTIAPSASANVTVNFAPSAVSRNVAGTLTFDSNDPINPTKTMSFCGEGVQAGMRVLVLRPNGTAYPSVDQVTLTKVPKTIENWKKLTLTTVTPPTSCKLVQYHLEHTLPATNPNGNPGVEYKLNVRVGNSSKTVTFTLNPCDYKEIVVTIP